MTHVALATNEDGNLFGDGDHLLPALARAGLDVELRWWRADVDWSAYDAVIVRSTWDYIDDRDGFVAWARAVESVTRLANPADVLEWNTDKRYLADLARAGVPCIPTAWVAPGEPGLGSVEWERFVVKPSVSAGARASASYEKDDVDAAGAHVAAIVSGGQVAMVQPHVASVDREGEVGTYVFGGEVTHAIRKRGVLVTGAGPVDDLSLAQAQALAVEPATVTGELADFARRAVAAVPGGPDRLLYARVDTVLGDDGQRWLLELELIEPFLFVEHHPPAADVYAAAVVRWLTSAP